MNATSESHVSSSESLLGKKIVTGDPEGSAKSIQVEA